MAGIDKARGLKIDNMDQGKVLALDFYTDEEYSVKYAIIKLDNNKGNITVEDYGSDVWIDDDLEVGDSVFLVIDDLSKSAKWVSKAKISFFKLLGNPEGFTYYFYNGEIYINDCAYDRKLFTNKKDLYYFYQWIKHMDITLENE